jgi:diphosphoinositol-polyphosphate diphosphatase
MGLFLSKDPANVFWLSFFKLPFISVQVDHMVALVPRTGRHLQRYDNKGFRQVVGCIPYRYRKTNESSSIEELEVLVISSQKGQGMLFPKGGWEMDESMKDAAKSETLEEAGVTGKVEENLGMWQYKSKRQDIWHESHMFPLLVNQQLDQWPEKNLRKRKWMTVAQAREVCPHGWMKEALEELVKRQMKNQRDEKADGTTRT